MEQALQVTDFTLWERLKRAFAPAVSPRTESYRLAGVSACVSHFHDNVQLYHLKKEVAIKMPLAGVIRRPELLDQMSHFDVRILKTLANEEDVRYGAMQRHRDSVETLSHFKGIVDDFYSPQVKKHMLVIEMPHTNRQECISLREFVNNEMLLNAIRLANLY